MFCVLMLRCSWRVACLSVLFASILSCESVGWEEGQLVVKSVRGKGAYTTDQKHWSPLAAGVILQQGAILRTEANSTADLILNSSGTALRLTPSTSLEVTRLEKQVAGEDVLSRTILTLRSGSLIGAQRKMDTISSFQILTLSGAVTIHGTEYVVKADGTVQCLAGSVWINDALKENAGFQLLSGFAFNPITDEVAAIEPGFITIAVADLNSVRENGRNLKKESGEPARSDKDKSVSPTKGNNGVGNGQDPQPPGNPPINDGPGTGPGNPGNKGGTPGHDKGN